MDNDALAHEWALLQQQFGDYEKYSLLIKLVATTVVGSCALFAMHAAPVIVAIVAVLWLQDAIWKTFQSRVAERIARLEQSLAQPAGASEVSAYQLHTEFNAQRRQGGALGQYLKQALRPTVAFPYAALIALLVLLTLTML